MNLSELLIIFVNKVLITQTEKVFYMSKVWSGNLLWKSMEKRLDVEKTQFNHSLILQPPGRLAFYLRSALKIWTQISGLKKPSWAELNQPCLQL